MEAGQREHVLRCEIKSSSFMILCGNDPFAWSLLIPRCVAALGFMFQKVFGFMWWVSALLNIMRPSTVSFMFKYSHGRSNSVDTEHHNYCIVYFTDTHFYLFWSKSCLKIRRSSRKPQGIRMCGSSWVKQSTGNLWSQPGALQRCCFFQGLFVNWPNFIKLDSISIHIFYIYAKEN